MKNLKTFLALLLLTGLASAHESSCMEEQPVQNLKLAYPPTSPLRNPMTVQFKLEEDFLIATFEVKIPENKIFYPPNKKIPDGKFPYNYDVVELFVSVEQGRFPYFEFELSPYDATFEVQINGPPKQFVYGIKKAQFEKVVRTAEKWTAKIIVPLRELGWNGDPTKIVGNAYSIHGRAPNRSYWGLLPKMAKPDFHRPDLFQPLLKCQ